VVRANGRGKGVSRHRGYHPQQKSQHNKERRNDVGGIKVTENVKLGRDDAKCSSGETTHAKKKSERTN